MVSPERDGRHEVAAVELRVAEADRDHHEVERGRESKEEHGFAQRAAPHLSHREHDGGEHDQRCQRAVPRHERRGRHRLAVGAEEGEIRLARFQPEALETVQQLLVERHERDGDGDDRRSDDTCDGRVSRSPPCREHKPDGEHDQGRDEVQPAVPSHGARRVDGVDREPAELCRVLDEIRVVRGRACAGLIRRREAWDEAPGLRAVDEVPEGSECNS